jgi:hypothetical protein
MVAAAQPTQAQAADKARLTQLSDVAFGLIAGTGDQAISQNLCAFSGSATEGYSVTASGNGPNGTFALTGGPAPLAYEVLWASSANQTGGTALLAGSPSSGFVSSASQQTCNSGPPTSATLTIVIRASTLSSARAGSYSGALQLTIAPE